MNLVVVNGAKNTYRHHHCAKTKTLPFYQSYKKTVEKVFFTRQQHSTWTQDPYEGKCHNYIQIHHALTL